MSDNKKRVLGRGLSALLESESGSVTASISPSAPDVGGISMIVAGLCNFIVKENKDEVAEEIVHDIEAIRLAE